MSGKRFQARAKTVQKLGRDGLVEQNVATGEEKRVSQRTADISFGPDRAVEQAAGHRVAQRSSESAATAKKKRRKQPRPVQQRLEEAVYAVQAPTVNQEIPVPGCAPSDVLLPDTLPPDAPSMRMAVDVPLMGAVAPDPGTPSTPLVSSPRRTQSSRDKFKRKQIARHTPDAASLEDRPMRTAGDAPLQNRPPGAEQQPPVRRPHRPMEGGGRLHFEQATEPTVSGSDAETYKKAKQFIKKHQVMDCAADAAQPVAAAEQRPSRLMDDNGGRLHFERATEPAVPVLVAEANEKAKQTVKKRQVMDYAANAAQPVAAAEQRPSRLMDDNGGRLHFERATEPAVPVLVAEANEKAKQAVKKRQVMDYAANAAQPEDSQQAEAPNFPDSEADTHQQRDSVQPEPKAPELSTVPNDQTAYKRRQAAKFAAYAAAPISGKRRRLQFEDTPPSAADRAPGFTPKGPAPPPMSNHTPASESKGVQQMPGADSSPSTAPKEDTPPPDQKYKKAVHRVERAEQRVEQARAKLPTKRRLTFQPEPDGETGKPRRRLHFEEEVLPEYRPASLPVRAGGMVKTAAVMKLHSKIHESERDNAAVEATHKSELVAEQGVGRVLRWQRDRRRSKPYRALRQADRRAAKENVKLAWLTTLRDHPELQRKNALSKWIQKQKIKRKYAQAAHEAKQTAQFTQNVVHAAGQTVRAVQQYAAAHKSLLAAAALLVMVVLVFAAGMTSCTAMLSGIQSSYISATYLANEQDICDSDLYYTQMETGLQADIDNTEENYPGCDEYRYNIGEICHNPYELMGYLSTRFNAFTFDQIQTELDRLFGEQYRLTREVITETRYDSDGDPYSWYVLQTTLTVKPLSSVIAESLPAGEEADRYDVYMQTLGRRQAYGSPFDFPWLSYVSSGYGWRIHPVTGAKDLHRGVDIAVAQGTPVQAIHDGRVISAGDAGDYGLCVVIEDEKGYQSRYAHCASLSVTNGQEIKRGDVIAAVGSTGDGTGPHLHLEIMLDGEYLNPYYFVETGSGGEVTGPVIPDYSGEPMGSSRFQALLTEAEKYLGYPYVWGGKNPATSFDCSGYVSWVINHSGWNVGSQGVIGLEDLCTPVSQADAKPGDLVFFIGTYDAPYPDRPTHVGIYVGGGRFIHCGDPISYANLNASYWQRHYYGMGRLPEP